MSTDRSEVAHFSSLPEVSEEINSSTSELKTVRFINAQLQQYYTQDPHTGLLDIVDDRTYGPNALMGLQDLERAAVLMPTEPWIWFQAGWTYLRLGSGKTKAQLALARVLELDPDNLCAHFIMASKLFYSDCPTFGSIFPSEYLGGEDGTYLARSALRNIEDMLTYLPEMPDPLNDCYSAEPNLLWEQVERYGERAWTSTAGEHLRVVIEHGGPLALLTARWQLPGMEETVCYWSEERDAVWLYVYLRDLGSMVPPAMRAEYYDSAGSAFAHMGWLHPHHWRDFYEEALCSHDSPASVRVIASVHDAGALQLYDPPAIKEACEALLKVENQVNPSEIDGVGYVRWMQAVKGVADAWTPEAGLSSFEALFEAAIDRRTSFGEAGSTVLNAPLAAIYDTSGRVSLARGDLRGAERCWKTAQQLDSSRASTIRALVELYIEQGKYGLALEQQKTYVELVPEDVTAESLLALLREASESGLSREEQKANHTQIVSMLSRQARQLRKIQVQNDSIQRALLEREAAEERLREPGADAEQVYSDTVDRLHALFLRGAQVQVLAIWDVRKHLMANLGQDIFCELLPDCQDFLVTAEVFYRASADIRDRLDAALVSVEFAKVVETEMRDGFMQGLARHLEEQHYNKPLATSSKSNCSPGGKGWQETLCKGFTLGSICGLFQQTLSENKNAVVRSYMNRVGPNVVWFEALLRDLTVTKNKYRNGAAHTERMEWGALEEFHTLLFEGKLLERLVELRRRVGAGPG